ncbi:MAG: metallophosphoesterase family protein [Planctomycetota bacterium]
MMGSLMLLGCLSDQAAALVRFVVTGDSWGNDNGVNTTILGEIAQATITEGADFILFTGDLTLTGSESQLLAWRSTMQPVYDAGIGIYPIRGNHDATGGKQAWDNVFAGAYALPANGPSGEDNITYSFTYENIFVVGVDQYVTPHRVNQAWVDTQLAANTQPHIFVFGHEPAFKVYHMNKHCLGAYPGNRNAFWSSIAAAGGLTYFCSHGHLYDHARIDNGDGSINNDLHQFVAGTAGAPPYSGGSYDGANSYWTPQLIFHEEGVYGYLLVEIDGPDATIIWKHRTDPNVYVTGGDIFTYTVDLESSDFDEDWDVDLLDFCVFTAHWLETGCEEENNWCGGADLNHLDDVGTDDLAVFAKNWLALPPPPLPDPCVQTSQPVYEPNEAILVNFSGASGNPYDWIGLYEEGMANDEYIDWFYTDGTKTNGKVIDILSGSVTFSGGLSNDGDYEARLFFDNSYNLEATTGFSVE